MAYKGLGNLGGFSSDLAAAIDQAVEDGVDVINYSIGGGPGLPGADDVAFLFAADAGVFVATSAGNDGPGPETVGNPATMPWVTTVGANTQSRFFEGIITLGNGRQYKGASLTEELGWTKLVDAADAGDELCTPGALDAAVVTGKIVLCKRGVVGRVEKSLAVFEAGGVGMIQYNADNVDNLFTDTHWVPSVHIDNKPGLAIKSYIDRASNPRAKIDTQTNSNKPRRSKWRPAPSMTIFSSRGPNAVAPDVIKPDVTAPGLQILAGASPFVDEGSVPGELFQAIAGTSMSSPHVAGIYALLKQAHPDWSAAAAKSALMTTASQDVRDNDRVHRAGPFAMGAGHVDPGGRWNKKGSLARPGLVYDAGLFEYAAFTCGMEWGIFSPGSCTFLEGLGVPDAPTDLNLPSIGISAVVGSETITRTVTSVTSGTHRVTYRAHVQAPSGLQGQGLSLDHQAPGRRIGHVHRDRDEQERTGRCVALRLPDLEGRGLLGPQPDRGQGCPVPRPGRRLRHRRLRHRQLRREVRLHRRVHGRSPRPRQVHGHAGDRPAGPEPGLRPG